MEKSPFDEVHKTLDRMEREGRGEQTEEERLAERGIQIGAEQYDQEIQYFGQPTEVQVDHNHTISQEHLARIEAVATAIAKQTAEARTTLKATYSEAEEKKPLETAPMQPKDQAKLDAFDQALEDAQTKTKAAGSGD